MFFCQKRLILSLDFVKPRLLQMPLNCSGSNFDTFFFSKIWTAFSAARVWVVIDGLSEAPLIIKFDNICQVCWAALSFFLSCTDFPFIVAKTIRYTVARDNLEACCRNAGSLRPQSLKGMSFSFTSLNTIFEIKFKYI